CKKQCDLFIVLLHSDPSIERPDKLTPILSVEERIEQLKSNRYIDSVLVYTYEKELLALIVEHDFNLRFLGDDYIGKPFTGDHLNIPVHYIERNHGWSTSKYKHLLAESLKRK
ncbi:MAG: glycerol-3-phosphate cytidylyltransferase, partial [Flavobacteriaceae bacterium]